MYRIYKHYISNSVGGWVAFVSTDGRVVKKETVHIITLNNGMVVNC